MSPWSSGRRTWRASWTSSRARVSRSPRRVSGGRPERRGPGMGDARLPSGTERARLVREMFDRIAGRYELLNTIMTAGLYRIWNWEAVRATGLRPGEKALDLACGTGSLTRDLAKRVGPGGYVLGIDFSREMLRAAKARLAPKVVYGVGKPTKLKRSASESSQSGYLIFGAGNIPDLD